MVKTGAQGDLNGFLDAGSTIKGELHFEDTFRVDGRVEGKVVSKGDLVVGEGGEVDAEIRVGRLFVSGTVRGRVVAKRVEFAAGGKVFADVETPSLIVEEGAFFQGSCAMAGEGAEGADAKIKKMPLPHDG